MHADHSGHDRPKHKKPKYFYDTPFAFIAFLLAFMMVVPIPRMMPIPQAGADSVADGFCSLLCEAGDGGSIICLFDPNDPDCTSGGIPVPVTQFCYCNDLTSFPVQGELNETVCNTSATCLDHGGWNDPSVSLCTCNDGTSIPVPTGSADALTCNTSDTCLHHGGPCDVLERALGVCPRIGISLGFFRNPEARAHALDPDSGSSLVDETIAARSQLAQLEQQAINEVLLAHGLPASDQELVLAWARDRVRAQLFTKLVSIIDKAAANRTFDEQVLYDWLTILVWQKRINAAQFAWDQYRAWLHSVEFATCAWHSPNETGIVEPTATGTTTNPGCSPGLDGIPGTDSTPNAGSLEDFVLARDDGETCFNFHNFRKPTSLTDDTPYYDGLTSARCAGVPVSWQVGLAAHPTVEEFLEYGHALARRNAIITPGFVSVIGNTFKAQAFGIGVGASALAAGGTGLGVYAKGGWALYTKSIAPFAGRAHEVSKTLATEAAEAAQAASSATTKTFARIVSTIAAAVVVLEVVSNILTAIETLLAIIEFNDIPIKLKAVVRAAAGTTETSVNISENYTFTSGKPNLATLITTDAGKQEIFFAFIETVAPEIDLSDRIAPAADPTRFWGLRDQSRNPVLVPPDSRHLLNFTAWDANQPWERQTAGLFGGWFVVKAVADDGTVATTLDLVIDYKDCDGEERQVWRVGGEEFVSIPLGTDLTGVDFTALSKSKEFQYRDWAGQCHIAHINHAPTATGFTVSGTAEEGQQLTLNGTGSDPDADDVSLVWDFNDGTSPVTGSPVQHAFADNGTFNVTMTPTDVFGATGPAQNFPVTIANLPPTATFATPAPTNEGSPIMLSLTNPSDPSTADTQAGFQYAFNCGDGFGDFGSSNTASCPTVDNGSFAVAAKIRDKDGDENTYNATAVVNNVAPGGSLLFTTQSVPEGSSFGFSLFNVRGFDPSLADTQAGFQFAFDCGGGFGAYSSANGVTCSTIDDGVLSVAGRIKDKDDGVGESTGTMNVTNVAPTAAFTATPQIFLGESSMLAFSEQYDPSPVDVQAGFTYAYDCTASGTLSVANNGAATATCKYGITGTFTVGGTISDKDQGATSYTATVTVLSPQQATDTLKAQVQALNNQKVLNGGQTNALTVKLDNAIKEINKGKKTVATNHLRAFINQVNGLIKGNVLSAAQGQELIDVANRLIASIAVS
jgi:hypothetical protein